MKKLLVVTAVAVMGSITVTSAADVVDSQVIDSAIAFEKAGGQAEFMSGDVLEITTDNYAHAETAKNYRNWMAKGANEGISHLRIKAPRGEIAPTVQMNHDSLYSVAITKVVDGQISFEIPENVEVYTSVQVIDQYGHGQHYIVTKGKHTVEVDTTDGTTHAFLDYPNIWGFTRDIYQMPGVAETTEMAHIKSHYFESHKHINPFGIVPDGPEIDFEAPHGRA